jgi:phage shock protein A
MGIVSRCTSYIKTILSSWPDRSEDPGMTLDYAYQQLGQLQNLRRSITDVVTNEKRLELLES